MTPLTKILIENGLPIAKPLYVLRRISDKGILNSRTISNTTGLPNPGPDQEYLAILTDEAPQNDPTFTIRTQTEGPNEATTPPQWEIHFDVKDRPKEEQIAAIENAKRFEVQKHFPVQDAWESMIIMVAALGRSIKGLDLTPDEKAAEEKLVAVAAKLTANLAIVEDMKAAVEQGQKPDISPAVWAPVDAATP